MPTSQERGAALRDPARRLVYWKDPDEALADQRRFLAQAAASAPDADSKAMSGIMDDHSLLARFDPDLKLILCAREESR